MKTFKIIFLFLILGSTYAFPSQIVKEWCVPYPLNDENISSISVASTVEDLGVVSTGFTYKEHSFIIELHYSNGNYPGSETYAYGFIGAACSHPYAGWRGCSFQQFSTQTYYCSGSSYATFIKGTIVQSYAWGNSVSTKVQALIWYDANTSTFSIDMYDYEWEPETT